MTERIRVLFVDDEPRILDGLRRVLRGDRQWDVAFAEGGPAALDALAKAPFDVVVSDMRMPGMNGTELLEEVRRRNPETVRLILSGHADRDATVRAVGPAHQYLAKPCDIAVVRQAVDRAVSLRLLLRSDRLHATVSRIRHLPALPEAYQRLSTALRNPGVSVDEVVDCLSEDVALGAAVLKATNSAFFGSTMGVHSVRRAVELLGVETVAVVILHAGVFRAASGVPPELLRAVSDHSVRSARFARLIGAASGLDRQSVEDAATAALLHEVGVLVLAANVPEYREVLSRAGEGGPLVRHEDDVLGSNHTEVGAYLLGLWGLPDDIVMAVALHEAPDAVAVGGGMGTPGVVAAAAAASHVLAAGPFEPEPEMWRRITASATWPELEATIAAELALSESRT